MMIIRALMVSTDTPACGTHGQPTAGMVCMMHEAFWYCSEKGSRTMNKVPLPKGNLARFPCPRGTLRGDPLHNEVLHAEGLLSKGTCHVRTDRGSGRIGQHMSKKAEMRHTEKVQKSYNNALEIL